MITFKELGNYGRLGNQLFQYAILKSVSKKTGFEIVLPSNIFKKEWHGQKCLLNNFKLPSCSFKDNLIIDRTFYEKELRLFDKSVFEINDNTNFHGFFQNQNFYIDIVEELRDEFSLITEIEDKCNEYLQQFKNATVSLHLRRGDASDGTNPIDNDWINDFSENSILFNYYNNAIKLIPSDSTIFLFTGGSRGKNNSKDDLNWCKEKFKDERIIFVEGLSDIECFGVMKNCDYNITSFASTFSWWASFLNKKNNVIAPSNFYPTHDINAISVYPKNWVLI